MREEELARLGPMAGTLGTGARVYRAGFVVPDLDEAVRGARARARRHVRARRRLSLRHARDAPRVLGTCCYAYAYSTRPAHVELIRRRPARCLDFDDQRRGHHLGVWTDDIGGEADRLDGLGMPRLWWVHGPDGQLVFSYHDTSYGFYIELVNDAFRPGLADSFRAADPSLVPRREAERA